MDNNTDIPTSYSEMFTQYLAHQSSWIGSPELPLVFHIKKLCVRLDADDDSPASMSSTYLQAVERLDKRRPRSPGAPGAAPAPPGQTDIFDFLD